QSLTFGAETTSSWTLDGEDVPYLSFQRASIGSTARMFAALAFNYPIAYRSTYVSVVERAPAEGDAAARLAPAAACAPRRVVARGAVLQLPDRFSRHRCGRGGAGSGRGGGGGAAGPGCGQRLSAGVRRRGRRDVAIRHRGTADPGGRPRGRGAPVPAGRSRLLRRRALGRSGDGGHR